jgi:probable blue pigment (indigoidine) exporter
VKSNLPRAAWTTGATVLAPISWGTSYVTITELLPNGRPLLVATLRVVPAGFALLIVGAVASRWRPRGAEWWRLGTLALFNFGIFFPLLVVAVYRLPGGVAAAAGGLQPLLVAALSWRIAGRRPRRLELVVGGIAALGVALVVIRPSAGLDPVGLLAAIAANVSFAVGVVLTKRFPAPANRVAATGWQLLMSGVILVPLTAIAEGGPRPLTGPNVAGFAYLSLAATALAFVLWFNGVQRLPTAAPPLLGLAAPITGAVLGWAILDQSLSPLQLTGFVVTFAAIGYGASLPASAADAVSLGVCDGPATGSGFGTPDFRCQWANPGPRARLRQGEVKLGRPSPRRQGHWRRTRREPGRATER